MAKDKPNINKTVGRINSKWLQNAVKSMGIAGTEVIKEIFPATTSAVSSTRDLVKESIKSAQSATKDANSIKRTLNNFAGVQMAKEIVENSIEDLKSGNLYNERDPFSEQGFSDDNIDDMFGDIDDMYGDDDSDGESPDVQINNQVVNRGDDGSYNATISVLNKNTEHQLKASKAQIDAMVSISSMQMAKSAEIGAKVIDALDAINNNIAALIEFNNDNMSKLISSSISFYEQMGLKQNQDDYSGGKGTITPEDVFDNGKFNAVAYRDYVKQNINNTSVMSMLGMVTDSKDMLTANPIGTLLKAGMENLIPKITKDAMQRFDKTVENFIPTMLERIGNNNIIGSIFGVRTERKDKLDPKRAEATPLPWNGIANHTLIEVIPKYLRESTGYLQEIAQVITGKTKDEMSDNFIGYNWETGQYQSVNDRRNEIADQFISNAYTTLSKTQYFKNIDELTEALKEKDPELSKQLESIKVELAARIDQHDGQIDWGNETARKALFGTLKGANDRGKNALEGLAIDSIKKGDNVLGELDAAKRKVSRDRNQIVKSLSDDPTMSGVHQVNNGKGLDEWENDRIDAQLAKNGRVTISAPKANISVPTILGEINSVLHRGLYVVVKNSFGDETKTNTGATLNGTSFTQTSSGLLIPSTATNIPVKAEQAPTVNANSAEEFASLYGDLHDQSVKASVDYEPDKGQFGSFTARAFNGMSVFLNGILHGDADKAFDSFIDSMGKTFSDLGQKVSDKFLKPIKVELFGEKDEETGYRKNGLFAGVNNKLRESYFGFRRLITGEGYVDSEGNKVETLTGDDAKNTVKYKLTNMLHSIRTGIETRLFGEKDEDGEGGKEGLLKKATNGVSKAATSLKLGLNGWRHALFGGSDEDDEDPEKAGEATWETIKEKAQKVLPSALAGSVVGAGGGMMTGGILGTLVGGPVGGALLGFAGGLASQSDKFKNWLFGEEDEDGNRAGGLISADTQKFFKDHAAFLGGGAALGAIKGGITGGGVLGTLVGGPVAGALMGLGTAVVLKSNAFQKFLFGDAEAGQLGIVALGKQWMKNIVSNKDENGVNGSKLLGMTGIGTAAGGLLGTLVGGPILGASMGLGASILAQKDNFHEWLFGSVDKETGAKREGIFGQFKNTLEASVFDPIKNRMKETAEDAKRFLYHDVLAKFNLAIEPIGDAISSLVGNISATVWDTTKSVGKFIKDDFLGGMVDATRAILTPITEAVSAAGSAIWTATKAVVAAPVNLLYAITNPITTAVTRIIGTTISAVTKPIGAAVKVTFGIFAKSLGTAAKVIGSAVALPFKMVSKTMNFVNDKIIGTIGHVGRAGIQMMDDAKYWILNNEHSPFVWIRKRWDNSKKFFKGINDRIHEFFDPVTDAMKSAIKYVGSSIKKSITDSIHNFFHALNPLTWIRKAGEALGFMKPKAAKSTGEKKGYFSDLWEVTKNGYRERDYSDRMVKDENGKVVGRAPHFNLAEARRANEIKSKNRKAEIKALRKENKDREYNQKLISKYTKGQRKTDTEENRILAEAEAKRLGKGIEFRGEALKPESVKKTEKFQDKSLDVQEDTNEMLHKIGDYIMGRTPKNNLWDERTDQYNQGKLEGNLVGKRDKALKEERENVETNADEKHVERVENNVKEARKRESESRREHYAKLFKERGFFDGLLAIDSNIRGIHSGARKGRKGKDSWVPEGTTLNHYAKGTDNAEPGIAVTSEEGPELQIMHGGEQIVSHKDVTGIFGGMLKALYEIRDNLKEGLAKSITATEEVAKNVSNASLTPPPAAPEKPYVPEMNTSIAPFLTVHDKPKVEFNKAKGITAEERKAQQKKEDAENAEASFKEQVTEGIQNVNEGVRSHNSIWNSIFSKKGLITGALILAAPLIWKLIKNLPSMFKNLFNALKDFAGRTWDDLQYGNDRLGDGRSSLDVLGDEVEGLGRTGSSLLHGDVIGAVKNFVYDKDGQVYNETGAREKLLAKGAAKGANYLIQNGAKVAAVGKAVGSKAGTVGRAVLNAGKTLASNVGTGYSIAKNAAQVVGDDVVQQIAEFQGADAVKQLGLVGESTAKKASVKVGEFAGKTAEAIGKAAEKTGADKVIGIIKSFFNTIGTKAAAKFGKVQTSAFGKLLSTVSGVIKSGYSKIAEKVSRILSGAAALGSTVIGLASKELTWVTLGAVNGLSGAARLFRTDGYADAKMIAISALFGAFAGTTIGSIADCVNELIVSVLGVDMFTELATLIYQMVSDDSDMETLTKAQDQLKTNYDADVDTNLRKQYQTMVQTGLIDPDTMDEDTWVEGAKSGDNSANIQSFADYNDEQNQTLASRAGKAIKNSTVAKALGNAKKTLFGYSEETFENSNNPNIVYRKNDNGTFSAYDKTTGKQIGEGELDRQTLIDAGWDNPTTEHQGVIKKAWTGVKDFTRNTVEGAKALPGNVKNWAGNTWSDIKAGAAETAKEFSDSWNSLCQWSSGLWNSASTAASKWMDNTWSSIKAGGTEIAKEFNDSAKSLGNLISNKFNAAKESLGSVKDATVDFFTGIPTAATNTFNSVKEKLGDFTTSFVETSKEEAEIIKDTSGDVLSATIGGDFDKFYNSGSDIEDGHSFAKMLIGLEKFITFPIAGITSIGSFIWDKVKSIFSASKNTVKDISNYASTLTKYTDINKDMSGFFNEKFGEEKNPGSIIIKSLTSGVMYLYVSAVRAVKSIAKSIKDKISNIGSWILNVITGKDDDDSSGGRGDLSNVGKYKGTMTEEEAAKYMNSIGGTVSGKGGRGIAPSTLNGGTYYSQNDIRWGNRSYTEANGNDASATMSDSGCGPTAMAMALNDVKGNAPDPTTLAHLAQRTGDRDETGTNANFISNAANAYGVTANETDNPSAGSIVSKIQSSGNPVVLLGQSYGNGPYTSSGHYVVAEGTDASGNIIINDPRGVEYSGAVAPESLSGTTSAAWSFENASQNGGIGGRGFRKNLHRIANVVGGYGDRDKWLNIVAEVKYQIAKTQEGYSQQKSTPVTIGGKTLKVRRDCSGLVSACLQFYGVLSDGVKVTSYSIADQTNSLMRKTGFTPVSFKNWSSLSSGDIVAKPGHTEIYATTNGGTNYVYNVGSDSSANNPYATLPAYDTYVTVWKVGKAGPNCVTAPKHDIQFDKNYKGDKITDSGSDEDSGSTSFFSKITGAFSAVANALFESAVTGETPDWDKVVNDYTSEYTSSGSSDDASADYNSDDISGDASEYNASIITGNKGMTTTGGDSTRGTIWKSLRSFGLNKEGAAGLMGAWTAESTLRPNNLEDYYNKLYGITDTQYTNYVDANNKWPDKKEHNVGYGLAQWTGANGNTQSGSKRKDGLLSLAKSTGASVGNLGVQLQYAETELKNNYPKAYKHLKNAPNVESAVKSALGEYEMPGWGMEVAAAKSTYFNPRLKYAKEILAKYKNSRDNFTSGGRGSLKKAIGDAATEAAGDFLTNQIDNYMDAAYEKYTGNKVDKDARKRRRAQLAAQQKLEEENKKKQQEAAAKKAAEKKKPKKQQAADAFAQVVTDAVIAPLVDEGVKQGKKYIENKIGYTAVDGVAGASAKAPANKKNGKGGRGSFDFSQIGDIMTSVFGEDTLRQASSMAKDLALDMASDTVKNNRSDIDQALKDGATKANDGVNTAAAKLDEMFPGLGYGDSVKAAWADMLTTNMPTINSTLDAVAARDQSAVTSRNLYSEAMNAYGAKDYQDLYSILSDPYGTLMSAASESGASLNQNTYAPVVPATDTATQQVTSGAISGGITTTTSTPQKVEVVNQYQQQAKSESSETTTQIVSIMGKIVDILDNIAASSDNLSELKNIKDGIANIHIPTVTTSGGSGDGSSNKTTTKKPSLKIPFSSSSAADRYGNDGISNNEYTARRIAFGR